MASISRDLLERLLWGTGADTSTQFFLVRCLRAEQATVEPIKRADVGGVGFEVVHNAFTGSRVSLDTRTRVLATVSRDGDVEICESRHWSIPYTDAVSLAKRGGRVWSWRDQSFL